MQFVKYSQKALRAVIEKRLSIEAKLRLKDKEEQHIHLIGMYTLGALALVMVIVFISKL